MRNASIELALVGLVVCAAACSGSNRAMQPEVPPGVTTTTGATTTSPSTRTEVIVTPPAGADDLEPMAPKISTVSRGDAPATSTGAPEAKDSTSVTRRSSTPFTDAEIAGVAAAAGLGERQHAREAMTRARSQRVRQLAHLLLTDRSYAKLEHVESVLALTPAESQTTAELRLSQTRVAESLRAAGADGFDRTYVDAQVSELRQFTQLLDDKLIPQAQNLELRQALQDLRSSAASHLGMATDIQSSILK